VELGYKHADGANFRKKKILSRINAREFRNKNIFNKKFRLKDKFEKGGIFQVVLPFYGTCRTNQNASYSMLFNVFKTDPN